MSVDSWTVTSQKIEGELVNLLRGQSYLTVKFENKQIVKNN